MLTGTDKILTFFKKRLELVHCFYNYNFKILMIQQISAERSKVLYFNEFLHLNISKPISNVFSHMTLHLKSILQLYFRVLHSRNNLMHLW